MPTGHQREVCWEKILETNPLFRITHPYVSREFSEQLVAIHALFASLDLLVLRSTDEQVARTKLEWWRLETRPANIEKSRHPVVGYLHESGAAAGLHPGALSSLIEVTGRRLEAKAPADLNEFRQFCRDLYQPRIEIEASLAPGKWLSAERRQSMAEKGGLILLMRDTFKYMPPQERALWWIPLSLLARGQVSRAALMQDPGSDSAASVFGELLSPDLPGSISDSPERPVLVAESPPHLHLVLQESLHDRQIERLRKARPSAFGESLGRLYLRDVFSLWKVARKIRAAGT